MRTNKSKQCETPRGGRGKERSGVTVFYLFFFFHVDISISSAHRILNWPLSSNTAASSPSLGCRATAMHADQVMAPNAPNAAPATKISATGQRSISRTGFGDSQPVSEDSRFDHLKKNFSAFPQRPNNDSPDPHSSPLRVMLTAAAL